METIMRPAVLSIFALMLLWAAPATAQSANPAEQFVSGNIRAGLTILNDSGANADTRASRFETFLLGATDIKRIALFTLGSANATPAQRDAFVAAFNNYAGAVYRSYFQNYSGQSLTVTGSSQNGPGDIVVHARLSGAGGANALPVEFRVRTDGPKPLVIDIGISGVWLALTQRDDFAAFLAKNNGDVTDLTAHLETVAKSYR
jgi:phospholipid transport system substrate-binding protein